MSIQRTSSGAPWETRWGYSRAVRVGEQVYVAGTTATDRDGKPVAVGDPYGQTIFILRRIEAALHNLGATLADVVRTRIYVTDIKQADEIGRAFGELLGDVRPVLTLIEASAFVYPEHLAEIEMDAVVTASDDPGDE